ncbi:hypothetical protein QBC40DRAFT_279442 [Triangularia verruculosa]|uniref:NACHT domain-containing protein n=1 Tax=Triangularia verruculosa TaxID=2587418 RepID=A0AAN6XIA0_9PEZI|nr:hypothetical protein QBC40DRAFT_279442 [Triangularia verruculosa]
MDPLSLAASVIAVVQLAGQVMKLCKQYIGAIQDVPADLRQMVIEISTLKGLFDSLNILVETENISQYVIALQAPAIGCRVVLGELEKLLDESGIESKKGVRLHTLASTWATLAWPRKRSQAQKMLTELATYKKTINLVLTADIANEMKMLRLNVEQLNDSLSSSERQSILDWLLQTTVDSSSNLNAALLLHEAGTGDWTFRTAEWRAWTSDAKSLLWIYGIPGAGKTVLASYLIETIKARTVAQKNTDLEGLAYHYCYHGRLGSSQDERPKLLAAVINQLCRQIQYIPEKLKFARASGACTLADLMEILQDLAKRFKRINVIIDAVDEAGERQLLLFFLYMLITHPQLSVVHILATSRDEVDIRRALEPIALTLCMSNEIVDEDIRRYVRRTLHSDAKFLTWPGPLLDEIEDGLVKGAKGMFRWANCQILTLRTLNTQQAVRKALNTLPATLDETYERILCSIPEASKPLAFRAFAILCSDRRSSTALTAELLRDAVLWGDVGIGREEDSERDFENGQSGIMDVVQDQLFDIEALREVCICLLTLSPYETVDHEYISSEGKNWEFTGRLVKLAHYTVKEYLMSDRIKYGRASGFSLTTEQTREEYLKPFLKAAMHSNIFANELPNGFPKLSCLYLSSLLAGFDTDIATNDNLMDLVTQVLSPETGAFASVSKFLGSRGITSAINFLPVSTVEYSENNLYNQGPEGLILARMIALELEETSLAYIAKISTSLPALQSLLYDIKIEFDVFSSCTLLDLAAASDSHRLCLYLFQLEEHAGVATGGKSIIMKAAIKALIFATHLAGPMPNRQSKSLLSLLFSKGADPNVAVGPYTARMVASRWGLYSLAEFHFETSAQSPAKDGEVVLSEIEGVKDGSPWLDPFNVLLQD